MYSTPKSFRAALILLALTSPVGAQTLGEAPNRYDFALSAGGGVGISASIFRLAPAGTQERFQFGLGLRSTFVVGELELKAASKGLASATGEEGTMLTPVVVAFNNVDVHLEWRFTDRVSGGANFDVFGFAVGASKTGEYRRTPSTPAEFITVEPAPAGIIGSQGSTNAEYYVAWWLNERYTIRGGLSRQRLGYRTDAQSGSAAPRDFELVSNTVFLGLRFSPQ